MGLQDRDYQRDPSDDESWRGSKPKQPIAITTILIWICVAVSLADLITSVDPRKLPPEIADQQVEVGPSMGQELRREFVAVHPVNGNLSLSTFPSELPLRAYTFLTYGFAHRSFSDGAKGILHLASNCLALYFLGRFSESLLGRWEFLRYYLASIVFAGLVYFAIGAGLGLSSSLVGASGAVSACLILLAWKIPNERLMLFGAVELPMWGIGLGYIAVDILGAMGRGEPGVSYSCHLGGALFATLYHHLGMNFEFLDFSRWGTWRRQAATRRNLKVRSAESEIEDLAEQADRLLGKVQEKGVGSLTKRERELLERYSRDLSDKRSKRV
jgi:membrane associated rhomboid family serine protease